jgi:hypothetical protein
MADRLLPDPLILSFRRRWRKDSPQTVEGYVSKLRNLHTVVALVFERLAEYLEPWRTRAVFKFGRQFLHLSNGSRLYVQANTGNAGHGLAGVSLIVNRRVLTH